MPPMFTAKDWISLAPQLVLAVAGMLVLLLDAIYPKISKRLLANLSVLGLAAAGGVAAAYWPQGQARPTVQEMLLPDGFTAFMTVALAVAGILSILLSHDYLQREGVEHGEYYALVLFTTLGGVVMAASVNLICVFIGLEILSISLYILAGYRSERAESDESAMKYFLLGAFSSAFFLYGIALVYGATNSVNILTISSALDQAVGGGAPPAKNFLLLAGIALMVVGFGFKVAVVPFHVWTPDVYEGAPTSVTAFMSVTAKLAGFAAFLRAVATGFNDQGLQWQLSAVLASIAAMTMLLGNAVAILQPNIKRMLAYSSIAHAGYMLAGLVAAVRPSSGITLTPLDAQQGAAVKAVLFYTLAYTVSNLGAFGVVMALRRKGEEVVEIRDLAGIGYKYPLLGVLMTLFMVSLAGLPPTAGFFGKLFLFQALVGMSAPVVWLILVFALTSVVSFYYYLGVVRAMYMDRAAVEGGEGPALEAGWYLRAALALSALGVVLLGLGAGGGLELAQRAIHGFVTAGPFTAAP